MKLITKEIEQKFKEHPFGSQDGFGGNAEVLVKYFNPAGAGTWLITEAEKQDDGNWLLYGYCNIFEWEWGSVSLEELENIKLPFGLGIERDLYTSEKYIKDYVDYPEKEYIALRSGYYFIPVNLDYVPFLDELKKEDYQVEFANEKLDVYDAPTIELSKQIDEIYGQRMGFEIDRYKIEDLEMS